ncbi:MAG: strawberry notch family protein [Pirellulales bacterium]|nr:strawberry notch family protein [Pirellulales bacterium]
MRIDFESLAAPAAEAAKPANESPLEFFALRFATLLEEDPRAAFDNAAVSELARETFGSSAGFARDAYDATEAGFNLYLQRSGLDLHNPQAALQRLLVEQERLPTQTRRDQQQVDLQQFSTPPVQALVVVNAAALCAGMHVLEPSAGTGNLATLARLTGAQVDTNEIDDRRRSLLTLQGFTPTALDAERLNNLLPPEKFYDAIMMNPPFSATGGRVAGHRTAFGARHVEQALLRLKPSGRLVAIVGCGMALDRPAFRDWWATIGKRYHVRANIGIDGREYAKFGTAFDNQIVVIDHDGPTTDWSDTLAARGLSVRAALDLLHDLSNENVYERICRQDERTRGGSAARDLRIRAHDGNGSAPGTDRLPPGGRSGGSSLVGRSAADERPVVQVARASDGARDGSSEGGHTNPGAGEERASREHGGKAELGGDSASVDSRSDGDSVGGLETLVLPKAIDIEEGAVFAAYRVQKAIVRGAEPHPANVVESAAMACVEPPDVTYRHHLPPDAISEGRVSDLQLEDVIYAVQATNVRLPDGSRKGHWNGDGTGIGKGREVYAFIYNELIQGRKKHVHISASHQLCADAERDRDAVGVPLPILHQAGCSLAGVLI